MLGFLINDYLAVPRYTPSDILIQVSSVSSYSFTHPLGMCFNGLLIFVLGLFLVIFIMKGNIMNDGDMDVLCLMLFLALTVISIFYSYTPIV